MPINTTTLRGDEAVLKDIIERTFTGDFYDDTLTGIGKSFYLQTGLTSASLPNMTSSNTGGEFYHCTELVSVDLPLLQHFGLATVSTSNTNYTAQFESCIALETVNIPLVTHLQYPLIFYGCSSLTDDCGIPWENLTCIAGKAFYGCSGLVNLSLPLVTSLGAGAGYGNQLTFTNCTSLRRLYMPLLTYYYGANTVSGCSALEIYRTPVYAATNYDGILSNSSTHISFTNMKLLDVGKTAQFKQYFFSKMVCYTKILILRKTDAVTTLASISGISADTTPEPIRVYVPSSLLSTYESASNWSSLLSNGYVTFYELEGSHFESTTFDDTAIYNCDRDDIFDLEIEWND